MLLNAESTRVAGCGQTQDVHLSHRAAPYDSGTPWRHLRCASAAADNPGTVDHVMSVNRTDPDADTSTGGPGTACDGAPPQVPPTEPATAVPAAPFDAAGADIVSYQAAVALARAAAFAYYTGTGLVCDDTSYDTLIREIAAVEQQHPDWVDGTSVAGTVAAGAVTGGDVVHTTALLSLDNAMDDAELAAWYDRLVGILDGREPALCIEPKLDGLAVAARYEHGRLTQVATRGDGRRGEDVTSRAVNVTGLPAQLTSPANVEIRGEIYMSDTDFAAANVLREAAGKTPLVNPRNGAAGALRNAEVRLPLSFAAYDRVGAARHDTAMAELRTLGIVTARDACGLPEGHVDTIEQVRAEIASFAARRADLGFAIDGAVVKVADTTDRDAAGVTAKAPRWAIAYKYPADTRLTTLTDIQIQVGRTGVLTPVAVLEPVFVGGATVTAASLANPGEVQRKDLRIGDKVWVRRAGEVIPEVTGPNLDERPDHLTRWEPPTSCPRCNGPIDTTSRRWRCAGHSCGAPEAVVYAASRKALDIDGLGPELVARLVADGLIVDHADLFSLTAAQLEQLDRVGERTASTLIDRIDAARRQPLERHLVALGIDAVGTRLSGRLAARFGSLESICAATVDELAAVDGIGPQRAAGIVADLAELGPVIAKLHAAGCTVTADAAGTAPAVGPLSDKVVVVTGKVPNMTRDEAEQAAARLGATVASSVSAKTDLLIAGDGAGSKRAKAERLGVTVIDADEFITMVEASS
jgi:DNA ligase (NAD+)